MLQLGPAPKATQRRPASVLLSMKKLLVASGVLLVCFVAFEYLTLPDVSPLKKTNPEVTALMRQREQEARPGTRRQHPPQGDPGGTDSAALVLHLRTLSLDGGRRKEE